MVAVKCLKLNQTDLEIRAMQKREIHAMADLKPHENIVTLHRVVESGEWLLLVMEFCAVGKL